MKLHWSPKSPYVRKVMMVAHEVGVADRLSLIRSVAVMGKPNPAIMADNPLNKIPVLITDEGWPIIDSRVICDYLIGLSGDDRLISRSGDARWRELSRSALADGLLDLLILWRNERGKPATQQSREWLTAFAYKAAATLDRFDREIEDIAALPVGLAQIGLCCALSYLDFRFADLQWRDGRAALSDWHAAFEARPSARATEIVDD